VPSAYVLFVKYLHTLSNSFHSFSASRPCWRPHKYKRPCRCFIYNRHRTYASLHVQLNPAMFSTCISNVIVCISFTSSASHFNAICLPFMLPRAALPRLSFSGGQGRFTTRGDPVSWTGAIIRMGRRTFRRREIRRGATDGGERFYIVTPALGQYMVYWNTLYLGHNSAVDCTISGWILREDEKIRDDQREWNEYCLWKKI